MTFWDTVRRELSGTVRSIGYDARRRLRTWRGRVDDAYPEYAAYVRRPRRALYTGGIAGLAALGVAGTYLALAGGLGGWLLGENVSAPNPGSSGAAATNAGHARRPAARPKPSPTPPEAPPPTTAGPHRYGHGGTGRVPSGGAGTPPTHRATSTPTGPAGSPPDTPTPTPTPTPDPTVTPTDPPTSTEPSPPDSPTPSATESAAFESRMLATAGARADRTQRSSSTISTAGA